MDISAGICMTMMEGGEPASFDKLSSTTVFPASDMNIASASYADVLNGSGGAPVQVSIIKGAGTSLLVLANMTVSNAVSNPIVTMGVNDGSTDYDLGRCRTDTVLAPNRMLAGSRLITGLAAGTYTITLRVKTSVVNTRFGTNHSASLSVMEVA